MNMKLEVAVLPVTDVDRAKAFYQGLGWRLDADINQDAEHRIVQFTPPDSPASVQFGRGISAMTPGSVRDLLLVVEDIEAASADPDGNSWLLQEVTERLPGRVWQPDVAALADLLHETADHHGAFEAAAPPHDWWDWYAAYMDARQDGSTPDAAASAAGRYMADSRHIAAKPAG